MPPYFLLDISIKQSIWNFQKLFLINLKENNTKLNIFTFWETALTYHFSKVAIKQLIFTTILVPKLQLYDILLYLIIFTPISMFYTSTVVFGCKFTPYHIQQLSNFSHACKNVGSHNTSDIISGLETWQGTSLLCFIIAGWWYPK